MHFHHVVLPGENFSKEGMVVKKYRWAFFLLILFLVSYLREVTFLSVNAYLDGKTMFYAKTVEITWLQNFTNTELIRLKYLLTAAYSVIFILITATGLRVSFEGRLIFRIAILIYMIAIILMTLMAASSLLIDFKDVYPYLRSIIHAIHTPLLYIILSISALAINALKMTQKDSL